jgi:hypothetical protein
MDFGELSVEPSTPLRLDPEQGRGVEAIRAATVPTLIRRQAASSGRFSYYFLACRFEVRTKRAYGRAKKAGVS